MIMKLVQNAMRYQKIIETALFFLRIQEKKSQISTIENISIRNTKYIRKEGENKTVAYKDYVN